MKKDQKGKTLAFYRFCMKIPLIGNPAVQRSTLGGEAAQPNSITGEVIISTQHISSLATLASVWNCGLICSRGARASQAYDIN